MGWLFTAFAIVWVVFFAYLFSLDRRQKAIAAELEARTRSSHDG